MYRFQLFKVMWPVRNRSIYTTASMVRDFADAHRLLSSQSYSLLWRVNTVLLYQETNIPEQRTNTYEQILTCHILKLAKQDYIKCKVVTKKKPVFTTTRYRSVMNQCFFCNLHFLVKMKQLQQHHLWASYTTFGIQQNCSALWTNYGTSNKRKSEQARLWLT